MEDVVILLGRLGLGGVLGLSVSELSDVELELLALEDVAVSPSGLAWAGRDEGVQTARLELRLEEGVDLCGRLAGLERALDVVGLLGGFGRLALLGLSRLVNGLVSDGLGR